MIQQREGYDACEKFYNDNMVAYGKYLQVLFIFLTYKGDQNLIKTLIDNFIKHHNELTTCFKGLMVIPEDEVTVKRRETIRIAKRPGDSNKVFRDTEVTQLLTIAQEMEATAKNGLFERQMSCSPTSKN